MGPTGDEYRVVQIHPTLRCNLRCLHCYSVSSPQQKSRLALTWLQDAISDAVAEGYNVVSVSGGEPLLYPDLVPLLTHAKQLGLTTTFTSNGILLNERRLAALHDVVDLIAISVDGIPTSHNRIRNAPNAFELMQKRLEGLRRSGIPFGMIFTLTLHNLHELDAVADFAVAEGAVLLQVHPLEEAGRASTDMANAAPDHLELSYAFLEVARIQEKHRGKLRIQFDVIDTKVVQQEPERVYVFDRDEDPNSASYRLADLVSPLIVEVDGVIVPIQYGFSHEFAIADLRRGRLREQAENWKVTSYSAFLALCQSVYEEIMVTSKPETPFANWYALMTNSSQSFPRLEPETAAG
jgi:MoaA/NifB/PqqE/SkfB family radical SAM enzyme